MRTIGVVTVARSDYGIYRPVLGEIRKRKTLAHKLIVAGTHLSAKYGMTVREIEAEGVDIAARVPMTGRDDSPPGVAESMAKGLAGFARAYARLKPDMLLVLGDRFEMLAAVSAAAPFGIPVAHIHGGERTEGAMDELFRHAISKMSHLHFAATREYGQRLVQMGEEPWRVVVSGAPGLDNLRMLKLAKTRELEGALSMKMNPAPILATYHPETLTWRKTSRQMAELLAALHELKRPVLFTYPNSDMGSAEIAAAVAKYVDSHPDSRLVRSLGTRLYFSAMAHAAAMVGNSSSGMIEAASFGLPVVNIGERQQGRTRGRNVIDVACEREKILAALRKSLSAKFRNSIKGMKNPYGDGRAAARIAEVLSTVRLDHAMLQKKFYDC